MKLNLGCAKNIRDGYINVDLCADDPRVTVCDVTDLQFVKDGEASEIYARDVLEHMTFSSVAPTIKHWCSKLQSGGRMYIQTINLQTHLKAFQDKVWDLPAINRMLFAGINYVTGEVGLPDLHKCALTPEYLSGLLKSNGMIIETTVIDQIDGRHKSGTKGPNLNFAIWSKKG